MSASAPPHNPCAGVAHQIDLHTRHTMPALSPTIQAFLDTNKDNVSPALLVTFPSGTQVNAPAATATKSEASQAPVFSLSHSCLRTHVPGAKYIAVALDLDAPSPSFPLASPILHYLHTDLKAIISPFAQSSSRPTSMYKTDTATNTWVELKPTTVANGGKGTLEKPLASWLAPAPPGVSAPHRYVFLVWEQPERMTGEQVREKLGMRKHEGGLWSKSRWDVEGFVRKLKLGNVAAGTWVCIES